MEGWAGSILRVNLTSGSISRDALELELARQYIGGRGLAAHFLTDEMDPAVDPLAPESKQIFSSGLLTGTFAPSSGRFNVVSKGPLSGGITASSCGGAFGAQLKYAGYDLLIIEGKAESPVYLWIHDDRVELRDAHLLWGKDVPETTQLIRQATDEAASVLCIGPAGENQVYFANLINDILYPDGHTGSGAVMGSKNLKAIAVLGSGAVTVADRVGFRKAVIKARNQVLSHPFSGKALRDGGTLQLMDVLNQVGALPARNFQDITFPQVSNISSKTLSTEYLVRPFACFACIIGCRRFSRIPGGDHDILSEGPELTAAWALGPDCGVDDLESIIKANAICNRLGLDSASMGAVLACSMEMFEKGYLTEAETGLDLHFGNKDILTELILQTALKKGFGVQLAHGSYRLAARYGHPELSMSVRKQEIIACDPRAFPNNGLDQATGSCGSSHLLAAVKAAALAEGGSPPDGSIVVDGVQDVINFQNKAAVVDSSGLCIYTQIATGMEELAALLTTLTGVNYDASALLTAGERIWYLEHSWNSKAGMKAGDNHLPERLSGRQIEDQAGLYYRKRALEVSDEPGQSLCGELPPG